MTDEGEGLLALPIGTGTVAGVTAWLVGYLVTYVGTIEIVAEEYRAIGLEWLAGEAAGWRIVGWLYYNAHGVDVRVPRTGGLRFVPASQNLLAADEGTFWVLYLLPVLVLLLAGMAVVWRHNTVYRQPTDAAIAGSTVTAGYLLCSVIGLVVFSVGIDGDAIRPDPITAVLLTGLAYPIVFGAVGGLVASLADTRAGE